MRETTETNAVVRTFEPVDNRFSGMLCKQGGRKGGGAFISQRFTLEWSFCTFDEKTKIKLFTDLRGIRSTCGAEE